VQHEEPLTSPVGIVILSLAIMPALAFAKQRTGSAMSSRALIADAKETWVCSYLSLSLLIGIGASMHCSAGGGPTRSVLSPCCP
jgi:divalent metal cation (Fe/Co/Zn/Cd) transporter